MVLGLVFRTDDEYRPLLYILLVDVSVLSRQFPANVPWLLVMWTTFWSLPCRRGS